MYLLLWYFLFHFELLTPSFQNVYLCFIIHLVGCFVPCHSIQIIHISAYHPPTHPLTHSLTCSITHTNSHSKHSHMLIVNHLNLCTTTTTNILLVMRHICYSCLFLYIKKSLLHCVISSFIYFGVFFFCFQKSIDRLFIVVRSPAPHVFFFDFLCFSFYPFNSFFSISMSAIFTFNFLHSSFCANFSV